MVRRAFHWVTADTGSLKSKVFRGGLWITLGQMLNRIAGLIKIVVLGRILAPSDFGLMAIGTLILQWLESFTQSGFNDALIRRQGDPTPYLPTVWTVQMLRGVGLSLLLLLGAPLGAWFFGNSDATAVIRAVAIIVLLRGISSPATVILRKQLKFQREVVWRLSGALAGLVSAIALGFWLRNAWALVISIVISQAAETIASYWAFPYRPRLEFDRERARELLQIGRWVFWNSLLLFLGNYMDSLTTGRILGTTALAFYQIGAQIALWPASQIGTYLRGLMVPAFAHLEDIGSLRSAYLRVLRLLCALVLPLASFVTVFAEPIVLLGPGKNWLPIAPIMAVLAWMGAFYALWELASALALRLGRPDIGTRSLLSKIILFAATVLPLIRAFEVKGVAVAGLLATVISTAYMLYRVFGLVEIQPKQVLVALGPGLLGAVPFLLAWLAVQPELSMKTILAGLLSGAAYFTVFITKLKPELRGLRS